MGVLNISSSLDTKIYIFFQGILILTNLEYNYSLFDYIYDLIKGKLIHYNRSNW
jgi:hypothetical protein